MCAAAPIEMHACHIPEDFMRIPVCLSVMALALVGGASPASAVTISGSYYEDQAAISCGSGLPPDGPRKDCTMRFALPSSTGGQFLFVEQVACRSSSNFSLESSEIFLSDGVGINERRRQPLGMNGTFRGSWSNFREEIQMKVAGGSPRMINITVVQSGQGSMGLWCAITGTLVPQVGGVGSVNAQ